MTPVSVTVLCEGPTEQAFVTQVLQPHLRELKVFAKPQLLQPRGGIVKFRVLRDAASRVLFGDSHTYVTTMLDLYGLPSDFPRSQEQASSGVARAQGIEAALREQVPEPRFLPYLQVHEFEALVLSDLDVVARHLPDDGPRAAAQLRKRIGNTPPEEINLGKETAPSKRILAVLPGYAKVADGPAIASRIGVDRLRQRCPHFAQWVESLEKLSRRAEKGE